MSGVLDCYGDCIPHRTGRGGMRYYREEYLAREDPAIIHAYLSHILRAPFSEEQFYYIESEDDIIGGLSLYKGRGWWEHLGEDDNQAKTYVRIHGWPLDGRVFARSLIKNERLIWEEL